MAFYRLYTLSAAPERLDQLRSALTALTQALAAVPGFEGSQTLGDVDQAGRVLFIERWSSAQAHKSGAASLDKKLFAGIMDAVAAPPESASFIDLDN